MSFGESLRTLAGDSHALVGFVVAAGLVLVLTPLVGRLAPLIGGLDDKADRPRVHKGAIPRIGGLAIVAGILIPTAILIDLDGPYLGIFIGTLLVAALGLFDDLHGVTPSRKLAGVTLIAPRHPSSRALLLAAPFARGDITIEVDGHHCVGAQHLRFL